MTASLRLAAALALSLAACSTPDAPEAPASSAAAPTDAVHAAAMAPKATPAGLSGTVKETMTSGGYTYALLASSAGEVREAAPDTPVAVGEAFEAPAGSEMRGFTSKTLNRTFESVFFVPWIRPAGAAAPAAAPHGATGLAASAKAALTVSAAPPSDEPVPALEGGLTVGAVFAGIGEHAGKEVGVRGRVVKVNRGILGADWLHLRDGTGSEAKADHDLTVTTPLGVKAKVGDVVVVRGTVSADKDFGAGYVYPVVVEQAAVTVE